MEPEGGGAHGPVGRPGWSADHPTGPTDLPFLRVGCSLGPLVIGLRLGLFIVGFLLWWALQSM